MIQDPSFRHYDQWGVQVAAMVQVRVRTYLYSALPPQETERAHMLPCTDIAGTVAALSQAHRRTNGGSGPRVLVLPYGQLTVPRVSAG